MNVIRSFLEKQLGATLILASLCGLACPFGETFPRYTPIILLAFLVFFSCYRINTPLRGELSWKPLLFCLGRYGILPIVLWYMCSLTAPTYALAVLLTALLPPGASSAALAGLYGGNVALGLVVTVLSGLASLVLIPLYIPQFGHADISIDPLLLLRTLAFCILLPVFLYGLLRKNTGIIRYSEKHGRLTSVLFLCALSFFAFARQRSYIFHNPNSLIVPSLIALGCYFSFMLVGFFLKTKSTDRIAYGVCSTFNNSSLGLSLAVLHFDQDVILFSTTTLILWAFLPFLAQPIINKVAKKSFT